MFFLAPYPTAASSRAACGRRRSGHDHSFTLQIDLKYHPFIDTSVNPKTVTRTLSVIGPGNWGSSLVHALRSSGVPLHEIIVPGRNTRSARGLKLTTLNRATLKADVLWLCVPDALIHDVAHQLVLRAASLGLSLKRRIVVHSSGALDVSVLESALRAGAAVAAVHPVMTFPTRRPVDVRGVPFGIEANGAARRVLQQIVRRIGGRPFSIQPGNKALYHAIGMLSSPLLVSHLAAAQQAAALAGFDPRQARELIEPIVRATLDNVFSRGPARSFSGPIARGDLHTIRLHLQALQSHPMLADVYRSLALYALEALPSSGKKETRRLLKAREPAS